MQQISFNKMIASVYEIGSYVNLSSSMTDILIQIFIIQFVFYTFNLCNKLLVHSLWAFI
jgi:hypothetical protein